MSKINGLTYQHKHRKAFDIVGFSIMTKSGGELYDAVRQDGRWEVLFNMNPESKTIYGVASDDACPATCNKRTDKCSTARCFRYTMGVISDKNFVPNPAYNKLYNYHVKESDWVIFLFEDMNDFGKLWSNDPYKMIAELGYEFNDELSNHIDILYDDNFGVSEFWMPVKQRTE